MAAIESRTWLGAATAWASTLTVAAVVVLCAATVQAQRGPGGGGAPTYQRKGTYAGGGWGRERPGPWSGPQFSSQTSAGSFQRPYPFHLDYYRMKWGGSYAPYFGNLYGPPNYFISTPFVGSVSPWGFNSFTGNPWMGGGWGGGWGGGAPAMGGPGMGGPPYGPWAGAAMPPSAGGF